MASGKIRETFHEPALAQLGTTWRGRRRKSFQARRRRQHHKHRAPCLLCNPCKKAGRHFITHALVGNTSSKSTLSKPTKAASARVRLLSYNRLHHWIGSERSRVVRLRLQTHRSEAPSSGYWREISTTSMGPVDRISGSTSGDSGPRFHASPTRTPWQVECKFIPEPLSSHTNFIPKRF